MDNNKSLYLLLKVVNNNSSMKLLLYEGLDFAEVAELTSKAIDDGYLLYNGGIVELSEMGKAKFLELEVEYKRVNKDEWIKPFDKSRIPRIDRNEVFLPNQNELKFL